MAAYAALVSLLNNIDQIKKHPTLSTSLDNQQIQPLVEKAGFLLEFMEDYHYGGGINKEEAEGVERQIATAAHAAEDVIESHIVDQIHEGSSTLKFSCLITLLLKCMGCHVGEASDTSKNTLNLQHILEGMDAVIEKATVLKEKQVGSREVQQKATHDSRATAASLTETGESSTSRTRMVGLDDELNQVLDELTGNKYPSSLHAISIVGMGGMGKTTLAKNVYQNSYIMQHFVIRSWATVSEQHDAHKILSQLLSCLGKSSSGTVDSLGDELYKALWGRRYLIILDDVWNVEAWDSVRRFFPDNGNRSRVVLTSRLSNVATVCGSSLFRMKLLDEEKSWDLFCEKVSIQHGDWPSPHLEEIGKEIVKLCKGLALSIVVIGGLLRKAPRTVGQWEDVVKDIKSIGNSKEKQDSLDVLSLSYTHLPPHLKPCFLYMGIFKEDSQIRVSNIVKLWVAEGFIKPNRGLVLEDIAEGYIKDLIDRNLVLVGRLRKNGGIGSCGIHDLLRDLCIRLGEEQHFFHQVRNYREEKGSRDRRLVIPDYLFDNELQHARSIIILRKYNSKPIVGRLVRVLDADTTCACPTKLYGNVNLRYLAYMHPYDVLQSLWKLPNYASLVWNLQTLIIKESERIVVVAPYEIWKMPQLRHVECPKIYLPHPDLPNNDQEVVLDKLQTLKRVVNLRLSAEMIPSIKKLHLLYDHVLHGYDSLMDESVCNLWRLHGLESLNLSINTVITLDPKFNRKLIRFPSSLSKLTLYNVELHWDDLSMIGSLPLLQVLKLEFYSVTKGERWSPIEGQFQSLKFLKIYLCKLCYWDADSSHFPVLEDLILESLYSLKEIPMVIGEISTLQLIRVDDCSNSVAISTVKIKQEQLDTLDNDDLQIQLKIYDYHLGSFKEELETEELTLDKIHLIRDNFH